jgi:hypothetical protein
MILARSVLLAALLGLGSSSGIRLHTIDLRGEVRPTTRQVVGTITTEVRTPLGGVPVTGRVVARYGCDGSFHGSLSYSSLIRVLARLRGATLVNVMEGHLDSAEAWDCQIGVDRIAGRLIFADSLLTGHLTYHGNTVPVSGFAWARDPKEFQSLITVPHTTGAHSIRVRLAER